MFPNLYRIAKALRKLVAMSTPANGKTTSEGAFVAAGHVMRLFQAIKSMEKNPK